MGTRLTIRGRTHYDSIRPQREVLFVRRVRKGKEINVVPVDTAPVPARSPDSPFRAGGVWIDPETNVGYRVVPSLSPLDGWGPVEHWTHRWSVTYETLVRFVKLGYLDAAIEPHAPTRRFRCRDEAKVLRWLAEHPRAQVGRRQVNRTIRTRRG